MKRILIALAVLLSVQVADAQTKTPEVAKKAVEAADAAAQNPKKATKVATWLKLATSYMDAYNAPIGNAWVGASKQELSLLMAGQKPVSVENVVIEGQPFSKEVYADKELYFNQAGQLIIIKVTKPVIEDALAKAIDAYEKAYEVDVKKTKVKDINTTELFPQFNGARNTRSLVRPGGYLEMAEKCLKMAKASAEMVMKSNKYAIAPSYKSLFTSEDLSSNTEVIMYRQYEDGLLAHTTLAYSYTEAQAGLSKSLAESFVDISGLPIYAKDANWKAKTDKDFFANRDPRLGMCIRTQYCIKGNEPKPFNYALSGYSWNKFMDDSKAGEQNATWAKERNTTDAPCVRYAEVLLNYAEATYELHLLTGAAFTQATLDSTINLIRSRADVNLPALQILGDQPAINGVAFDDPKRLAIEQNADGGVTDAMLWEIRRERRVELCMEGFRNADLKRWCKLDYMWNQCNPDIRYGAYIQANNYPQKAKEIVLVATVSATANDTVANEGYILRNTLAARNRPLKRNYINPIPSGQITLYKSKGYTLTQNPDWQ